MVTQLLFFFNSFILFYLFLAVLGLHCCVWAFSSCGEWGLLFDAVHGLLIVPHPCLSPIVCLGVFLLGFILCGTLCVSWTWVTISFPMLGKFSTLISSNIFSDPFFFSSSSGTPIIQMLVYLVLSQMSLRLSSIIFILFSLFCCSAVFSTILSSS